MLVLLCAIAASACDAVFGTENNQAKNARVIISGSSAVPLQLVTSTDFEAIRDNNTGEIAVTLTVADTTSIAVPLDQTFPFNGSDRFFINLSNPDPDVIASIRLRLLVDGREVFDESANMQDAALEYTFFKVTF
jgi:hypothetical protein